MKKMLRATALATIIATLMSGCGKGVKNSNDDLTEVSFLLSASAASSDLFIWKDILREKFGINAKFEMAAQDAHLEKLNLLIASNNLPDVISPVPSDIAKKIGLSGMLVNYNDYLDEMPDFKKAISEDSVAYASLFASDGGIYVAPQYVKEASLINSYRYVPTIREDLVKETGMDMPKTYEELYDVLKAIKKLHPDSIGIINRTGTDAFKDYGYTFGVRPDVYYNYEDDKYEFGPNNERYKDMLKFMNKLWNEGLLDKEFFTASKAQFESKLTNGLGAFYFDWAEFSSLYSQTHKNLKGDDGFSLIPIGPITPDSYPRKIVQTMDRVNPYCSMCISSQSEARDKLIKFVNWLYSDEGADMAQYGIEGDNYTVSDDGTYKFNADIVAEYNSDGTIERDKTLGINLPHIRRITTDKEYKKPNEFVVKTEEALAKYLKEGYGYSINNGISLTFTEEETEEKSRIASDINTCVNEWSIGLVTGSKSFDDYDKFISETKQKGADKLVEINNNAYERFKNKLKEINDNNE